MSEATNGADQQPDELNELSAIVEEFTKKIAYVENEMETLKEDRKAIIDEYKEKLDMKTLNAAMKIVKVKRGTEHKHTLDTFLDILENRDLSV